MNGLLKAGFDENARETSGINNRDGCQARGLENARSVSVLASQSNAWNGSQRRVQLVRKSMQ
jgi:hypothetical protein